MLNILVLIFFGIIAFSISKSISNETAIFVEYRQSTTLQELVFLFPVGPIVLFLGAGSMLTFLFAAACYIPAMFVAHRTKKAFREVGKDTVYGAIEAVSNAYAAAVGGILYVVANFIFGLTMSLVVQ